MISMPRNRYPVRKSAVRTGFEIGCGMFIAALLALAFGLLVPFCLSGAAAGLR